MGWEPRHPGDAENLRFLSRAPTYAPVVDIRDLLLVPTTEVEGSYRTDPPAGDPPVEIATGLVIAELPPEEVDLVMNACMPRGHYFIAVRQFAARYAFVRSIDAGAFDEHRFGWDVEHLIFYAMVLSRLVRDNTYSFEFAGRIITHEDGMRQVVPVRPGLVATYRLRSDRDWLTVGEAAELRELLAAFLPVRQTLPWRVIHGLNVSEDAVHLRIMQRALLLIATGLEGLIQSSQRGTARQFRERLPRLADDVGVPEIDEAFARELYDARSEAAHGAQVSMFRPHPKPAPEEGQPEQPEGEPEPNPEPEPAAAARLARAQDLLRAAVRKAIEEPAFRQTFESAAAIEARWPL